MNGLLVGCLWVKSHLMRPRWVQFRIRPYLTRRNCQRSWFPRRGTCGRPTNRPHPPGPQSQRYYQLAHIKVKSTHTEEGSFQRQQEDPAWPGWRLSYTDSIAAALVFFWAPDTSVSLNQLVPLDQRIEPSSARFPQPSSSTFNSLHMCCKLP